MRLVSPVSSAETRELMDTLRLRQAAGGGGGKGHLSGSSFTRPAAVPRLAGGGGGGKRSGLWLRRGPPFEPASALGAGGHTGTIIAGAGGKTMPLGHAGKAGKWLVSIVHALAATGSGDSPSVV